MKVIWREGLEASKIALSSELYEYLQRPKELTVHFGSAKLCLKTVVTEELTGKMLGLPKAIFEDYTMPKDISYEFFIQGKEVCLGPVIAYLSIGTFKNLKDKTYVSNLIKFLDYSQIGGLLFICTSDSIDLATNTIEGYYFDPQERDVQKAWKYGKFPLPNAIFNRSFMPLPKIEALRERIGDTIFNSYWYNLNKWQLWKSLSKDTVLRMHLPYTEKFAGLRQLRGLLKKQYKCMYLKPCNRSRGKGIMEITRTTKGYSIVNARRQKYVLKNEYQLKQFFRERLTIPYIMQQAVLFRVGNRKLDFRLFLQKGEGKKWSRSGLIARVSKERGIITNWKGREKTIPGWMALKEYYNLDDQRVRTVEAEMTDLAIRAVQCYENKGMHLGDLAADIVLDSDLNPWLLELQLNYDADGRSIDSLHEMYSKLLTTPFIYAKALAGFYQGLFLGGDQ